MSAPTDPIDSDAIVARVEQANVVGMGGGGFPAAAKLDIARQAGVDTVIGNAMATEPEGLGDDYLLKNHRPRVLAGLEYARIAVNATTAFIAVGRSGFPDADIRVVDAPFPAGEERRLTLAATGREIPANARPTDIGVVVFNVATLAAIADAVRGQPNDARFVGIDGTVQLVPFGTTFASLGFDSRVRVSGFSGTTAFREEHVTATTLSVRAAETATPCIRCGWCAPACPVALRPDALHEAFVLENDAASVTDCIECGACNAACPAHIDLVNEFRTMKSRRAREVARETGAKAAKARVEAREERLERLAARELAGRRARRERRRSWQRDSKEPPPDADSTQA